jgi:hypothetical protein
MEMPLADIGYIAECLQPLAEALIDSWDDEQADSSEGAVSPTVLCDAIEQLLVVLRGHEQGRRDQEEEFVLADKELTELVDYGIQLFVEAARQAETQTLPTIAEQFESLSLPLALWGAGQGVELDQLAPVVDTLARLANLQRDPHTMVQLYEMMDIISQAANPRLAEADLSERSHPLRILLLNRAIVATRSHQPALMEPAFDAIVEWLPEEAAGFFAEGMEQMDVIGYPDPVRQVMQTYYLRHSGGRTLH